MAEERIAFDNLTQPVWYRLNAQDQAALAQGLSALQEARAGRRIWARDGTLWLPADSPALAEVENRLGWLELPTAMLVDVPRLRALAAEVQGAQIRRVVLLGMGGSSLAPEVLREVLGVAPDHPDLVVLDSTDPGQIRQATAGVSLAETLFLVSSKSGTTVETTTLYAYFRAALRDHVGEGRWRDHFIAIADPHTPLSELAHSEGFRALYQNPPDIGGRYSALSYFGLVPAALIGVDLERLLRRAKEMATACRAMVPVAENPGMILGALMGELARHPAGPKDKLTLLCSPRMQPFGPWAEQLIAESTGKEGRGILPVEGEPWQEAGQYGADRLFVFLRLAGDENAALDDLARALIALGRPVILCPLADVYDLGGQFWLWEFATAIAGQRLGINPFDQPNVEAAKIQARQALARYRETQSLPQEDPVLAEGALTFYGPDYAARQATEYLRAFLGQARPGDYVALMAYIGRNQEHIQRLQQLRACIGGALRVPVTIGFGPRFLHSTGQFHKGGPNTGLMIQLTQDEAQDLPIPGEGYTFGILKLAQALGDLQALREAGRRVIRVHLGQDVPTGLAQFQEKLARALEGLR
jgi:transaldolase/glucose-6-phosphate isomerase